MQKRCWRLAHTQPSAHQNELTVCEDSFHKPCVEGPDAAADTCDLTESSLSVLVEADAFPPALPRELKVAPTELQSCYAVMHCDCAMCACKWMQLALAARATANRICISWLSPSKFRFELTSWPPCSRRTPSRSKSRYGPRVVETAWGIKENMVPGAAM